MMSFLNDAMEIIVAVYCVLWIRRDNTIFTIVLVEIPDEPQNESSLIDE